MKAVYSAVLPPSLIVFFLKTNKITHPFFYHWVKANCLICHCLFLENKSNQSINQIPSFLWLSKSHCLFLLEKSNSMNQMNNLPSFLKSHLPLLSLSHFWEKIVSNEIKWSVISEGVKIHLPLLLFSFFGKIVSNQIKWPLFYQKGWKSFCLSCHCLIFGKKLYGMKSNGHFFFIKRGKNPPSSPIIVSFFGKNVPNHIKWPLFLWGENPPASPIIIIFWKKLYRIKSKGVKATCPSSPPLEQPLRALDCAELLSTRPPCCLPEIVYACLYYSLN